MDIYVPKKINNYEFTNFLLGKGSFAVVRSAVHVPTHETVAIKIISKESVRTNRQLMHQVYQEVQALKQCDHPFIAKFFDFFEDRHYYYIVQEYVNHGTLLESVNARGRLDETQCRKYFSQILSAIDYLHNMNILHRDLKAENILLDGGDNVRLIDFGLCKIFDENSNKYTSTICGSFTYAAPEVIKGEKYSIPADIWALGVLLYAIANCQLPFEDQNNKRLCQKILYSEPNYSPLLSPSLVDLISKMLKKNQVDRISIKEIKDHPWISKELFTPNFSEQSINQEILNKMVLLGFSKDEVLKDLQEGNQYHTTISFEILKRSRISEYLKNRNINQLFRTEKSVVSKATNTKLPMLNLNKPKHRLSAPVVRRLSTNELRDTSRGSGAFNFSLLLNLPRNNLRRTQLGSCSLTNCD